MMLQRVHIQILDNPLEELVFQGEGLEHSLANREIAEELRQEMEYFYPSVVFVEYIDLFTDDEEEFDEIRGLLKMGLINTPVVLINGVIKIQGGIPSSIIRKEIENLLSSGPVH
ncbi:MAG: hypothetical protein HXY47_04405 [Nitrospirae bacterium]|nr:hypothetical protein [Nitrospirota bacterium]